MHVDVKRQNALHLKRKLKMKKGLRAFRVNPFCVAWEYMKCYNETNTNRQGFRHGNEVHIYYTNAYEDSTCEVCKSDDPL